MLRIRIKNTNHLLRALFLAVSLVSSTGWLTALTLGPLLSDGAVFQRDMPMPIRGTAESGKQVVVTFQEQRHTAQSDNEGRWIVWLAPMKSCAAPAQLVVTADNKTACVRDILVGDVWLCSGQSNMAMTVSRSHNAAKETAAAKHPLIRHTKITRAVAKTPATSTEGSWEICTPETVRNFSAAAYFFARELQRELNVPIGLIHASWGGTQIESWMSEDALRASPFFWPAIEQRWLQRLDEYPSKLVSYSKALEKWKHEAAAAKKENRAFSKKAPSKPEGDVSRWMPAGLYNGMIHPLLPMAVRGIIWYQGETNATRPEEYADLFPRMISQWRDTLGQPRLPFYFVQLPNLARKNDAVDALWAVMREAQMSGLRQPGTAAAITIDIGESDDIHPRNKQEVGRRLALIALSQTHGLNIECSGPTFQNVAREKNNLRIHFSHAQGLTARIPELPSFEIAGADKRWHPARAHIENETVLLSTEAVPNPVYARYAWHNDPVSSLYNKAGLPAAPFCTATPLQNTAH